MRIKKMLAGVLAVVMVMCMTPMAAFAAEGDESATELPEAVDGVITLESDVKLAEDVTIEKGTEVALDLNGYTITGTGTTCVFNVSGTLTLEDNSEGGTGMIIGGEGTLGGGIRVNGGTLIMNGGAISGNYASTSGGGVYVDGGTFEMNGGEISNNSSITGGGIYISGSNSTFTMTGGQVSENKATSNGGGIYVGNGENVVISGGIISGNEAKIDGGGIFIYTNDTVELSNVIITGNSADAGAGMYLGNSTGSGSSLIMNSGIITGNHAVVNQGGGGNGGGIYVSARDNFEMKGGAIYGNTAATAGADIRARAEDDLTLVVADTMDADNVTIIGWYEDSENARYAETENPTPLEGSTEHIKVSEYLIAAYSAELTYDANGGSGDVDKDVVDVTKGETAAAASGDGLTNSGYIFTGWNTEADGTGTRYSEGDEIELTENTTLYAQWEYNGDETGRSGSYIEKQEPTIITDEGASGSLYSYGRVLTITVADGYELADVTLNGESLGAVTIVEGLKTGDVVEVITKKAGADDEALIEAIGSLKLVARSEMSSAQGKKAVKVYWYAEDGSDLDEYDFDGYQVYRSLKRYSGFGTKPIFKTSRTAYWNTAITTGTKYYYKVRGYKTIGGATYYTDWSKKAWRTVK